MLKACSYCGYIHSGDCDKKEKRNYKGEHSNASASRIKERKFRSSTAWQTCREEILLRDKHLCRVCLFEDNYIGIHDRLDVHHIESLHKAWHKRITKRNLITLCKHHHYLADNGEYTEEYLKNIITSPPRVGT